MRFQRLMLPLCVIKEPGFDIGYLDKNAYFANREE